MKSSKTINVQPVLDIFSKISGRKAFTSSFQFQLMNEIETLMISDLLPLY